MATLVRVEWKAFSSPERAIENRKVFPVTNAAVETSMFDDAEDFAICNKVYQETNLYYGKFWNDLEQVLPANRSHTAVSIDDEITISRNNVSKVYRCAEVGWELVNSYQY